MSDRARSRSPRRDRGKPSTSDRDSYDRRDIGRRDDRDRDRRDDSHTDGRRDHRDRERGEDDRPRPRKKKTGGFNFKDKRRDDDRDDQDGSDRRGGGGGGSSYRGYRNRSPSPRRSSKPKTDAEDTTKPPKRAPAAAAAAADTTKPPKRAPAASGGPGLEMIIVHVNDRLGTKAAIPCLPSDTIRQFKLIRPFKDMLTLADYEISNGVQLDLEVDTGD
ncbi:hypothetical protein PG994_002086 [Apiospora phragmitis]|uniref:Ubiquitin-like modifier HUB1 n=1 Tax=Apiospora phragmitis TaxID=2905665 RepID=A0ABR1WVD2_9PEZI